jgi:hypothetical protein
MERAGGRGGLDLVHDLEIDGLAGVEIELQTHGVTVL